MAFTSAITKRGKIPGNCMVNQGTYTSADGSTGGDIDTGLLSCESLILQPGGSSVIATAPVVNETLPVAGNAVTIVTAANEVGTWEAKGY